jgi:hypothetical protein
MSGYQTKADSDSVDFLFNGTIRAGISSAAEDSLNFNGSSGGDVVGLVNAVVCEPQTTFTATENVTLNNNHGAVILCGAAGAITLTLPAAATARKCHLTFINKSGNAVTIDANGSETIDGSLTIQLSSVRSSVTLLTDGTEWFIVSRVPSS